MSASCCGADLVVFTSSTGGAVLDEARCTGCGRRWELRRDERGKSVGWRVVRYGDGG